MMIHLYFFALLFSSFVAGKLTNNGTNASSEIHVILATFNETFNDINDTDHGNHSEGNTTHEIHSHDHHHHHDGLSSTVLRWIPGGISVGIFLVFTIAAAIRTHINQGRERKEMAAMPDVADSNFFEIDVIAKLKKKDKNIFQRHLSQAKSRKYEVYNTMMRQYKDEIIARRAQEARHAEMQKELERKKKEIKEASLSKLGPLAKRLIEGSPRGNVVTPSGQALNTPTLNNVSLKLGEKSIRSAPAMKADESQSTLQIPTRSASEGDKVSKDVPIPSYRHDVKQEDDDDEGIMMKMKPRDCKIRIDEETSFSDDPNDGKLLLHDLKAENLYESRELIDDDIEEEVPTTYLAPLNKSDSSIETVPLENMGLPKTQNSNFGKPHMSDEQTILPNEVSPKDANMNGGDKNKVDEDEEEKDAATPWKKIKASRPFTWFSGGNNSDYGTEDTDDLVAKFRAMTPDAILEENGEKYSPKDKESERIDELIGQYVQNALASRNVDDKGESSQEIAEEDNAINHIKRPRSRSKRNRPFTWFSGGLPDEYYFSEGSTDSLTELVANFMDLGPLPETAEKRKSRPLSLSKKDEEKILGEMEKRIIENMNDEQDKEHMHLDDVLALERILAEYSELVKGYSTDSDVFE